MTYTFTKLTQIHAEEIAGWNFPADYQWTTLGKGSETEYYLLRDVYRQDSYFEIHEGETLLGYFSVNNKIRSEAAGLQFVIQPGSSAETEREVLHAIEDFVKELLPEAATLNVMCYSTQTHAIEIYESLGYTNHGPLVSYGHDMASYEQDGFNLDQSGNYVPEIQLIILYKTIR
ncbi:MAG: hypothetical protein IJ225_05195 [Solobacterium sp.]|nr:hypothetical protein [Solobacterium sp.]